MGQPDFLVLLSYYQLSYKRFLVEMLPVLVIDQQKQPPCFTDLKFVKDILVVGEQSLHVGLDRVTR